MRILRAFTILVLLLWIGASGWYHFVQTPQMLAQLRELQPLLDKMFLFWLTGAGCAVMGVAGVILLLESLLSVSRSSFIRAMVLFAGVGLLLWAQWGLRPSLMQSQQLLAQAEESQQGALVAECRYFDWMLSGSVALALGGAFAVAFAETLRLAKPHNY